MLRITAMPTDHGQLLKVEGKLLTPWHSVLQSSLAAHSVSTPISLDLSGLSFADPAGLQLIRDALAQGIELSACTGYLRTLLRRDDPCQL